ncbi:MAG: CRISPR-associated endonuclease Cas1, partial [Desulfobulbaceae bacterium]|nr:CRISPR-associated endonuclease Cas1 [Desulfobulbaceae bacterium]
MKKLLNTLYVTSQGAYLNKEGETITVNVEREVRLRLPIHTLAGVVCFGNVMMSPFLMGFCAERGVRISFLTEYGKFLARIEGPVSGNVLLRRQQYRWADDPDKSAEIARAVVMAKVANCRTSLQRVLRDHSDIDGGTAVKTAVNAHESSLSMLMKTTVLDSVRGVEGDAARQYFSVFDHLIVAQKEDFFFRERSRRPPLDKMNALLSFLYTLLMHDVRSA